MEPRIDPESRICDQGRNTLRWSCKKLSLDVFSLVPVLLLRGSVRCLSGCLAGGAPPGDAPHWLRAWCVPTWVRLLPDKFKARSRRVGSCGRGHRGGACGYYDRWRQGRCERQADMDAELQEPPLGAREKAGLSSDTSH